jgi:hypothetical protein
MPTASCFAGLRQNVVNCGLLPDKFYSIQERRAGRGPLVEAAEDSRNCLKTRVKGAEDAVAAPNIFSSRNQGRSCAATGFLPYDSFARLNPVQ